MAGANRDGDFGNNSLISESKHCVTVFMIFAGYLEDKIMGVQFILIF